MRCKIDGPQPINNKQLQINSKKPLLFAEALKTPHVRYRYHLPMKKRVSLKMSQQNFLNNLDPSGLSRNHAKLSKDIQKKWTKNRRPNPLSLSQVLNHHYKYG